MVEQALGAPGVNQDNQEPPNSRSLAFHDLSEEEAHHTGKGIGWTNLSLILP
jgi:hypothetical protein